MSTLAGNLPRLCAFRALQMTLFPVAVITLFWKRQIGMSMTEILLAQGCFGIAMAALEFPSGYLADRIGYRKALLLASVLMTGVWAFYGTADTFASVLVAEIGLGASMSLISGSDSALMYESLLATGGEHDFARWNGRQRFWGQTAEGSAALAAGVLFVVWERLPFVLQVGVWASAAVVAYGLVEPPRHTVRTGEHWRQVRSMVRTALAGARALRGVIIATILLGLSSFIPVWLVPLYATGAGVEEAWIGPIWAVANYMVALGSIASAPLSRRFGLFPTLFGCVVLVVVGYLGLGLTYAVYGFAFYFCLTLMRGIFGPVLLHEEQRLIPSSDRAGFLSLRGALFRIVFFALAPALGLAIDAHGQRPVLVVLGAVLGVANAAAFVYLRSALRSRGDGAVEPR